MFYKNTSYTAKTFYGVTFQPGETKEVDGSINNRWMILADGPTTKETKAQQKPSPAKPMKEAPKEDKKQEPKPEEVKEPEKAPQENKEPKS